MLYIGIFFSIIYILKVFFVNPKPKKAKKYKPKPWDKHLDRDGWNKQYYNYCAKHMRRAYYQDKFKNLFK